MNPQRKKPQIFTKSGPAVNRHFLVLASAWPPRAQYTQNYNVITQAGAHGEDSHLGRRTPGAGRHKGQTEAEVTCIYIFNRGGLKYNFNEDCIMDYCLRKLWQRTKESLSFSKGAFSSTGVEGNGIKREGCCFYFLNLTWAAVVIMCDSFLSKSPCDAHMCVCVHAHACVYFIWTTHTLFGRQNRCCYYCFTPWRLKLKEDKWCVYIIS